MRNQRQIHVYILMMVHNNQEAEDLMQETAIILWEKFSEYQPGKSFSSWGIGIARNVILNHRRKQERRRQLFDEKIYQYLETYAQAHSQDLAETTEALRECMSKLNRTDRRLVAMRYEQRLPVKRIAEQIDRSVDGLYQSFTRIYSVLRDCLHRRLSPGETVL